jgi:heat shock protein HtpX
MASYARTAILLGCLSAILLLIGQGFGGEQGLVIAFLFAVVMNFGAYWFSDRIVLTMYRAQPVGRDHPLHRVVERLAMKARIPMPKVFVIPSPSPNAFATGRNPSHASVAATEGILRLLDEEELEAVMAHELSHVRHRDILISSVAATVGAAIMMLANMARWAAIFGGGSRDDDRGSSPVALLATALIAPIAAVIVQAAISRTREFAADEGGAKLLGHGRALARAQQNIDATVRQVPRPANTATAHMFIMHPFAGAGGVMRLFSTHPPTEERVKRLMRI